MRLIGENGEQLGIVPLAKALQIATEAGLDLVEVSPNSSPSVCRILNYGKYKYEQTKKERKSRHTQKAGLLKEVRIRPRVQIHDLETKIKTARRLLRCRLRNDFTESRRTGKSRQKSGCIRR